MKAKFFLAIFLWAAIGLVETSGQTPPGKNPGTTAVPISSPDKGPKSDLIKTRQSISLDFSTGLMNPIGVLELAPGEEFLIKIMLDSDLSNFSFDISGVEAQPEQKKEKALAEPSSIEVLVRHQARYEYYRVVVTKKNPGGESKTWMIPVTTIKWSISFSGGVAFSPTALGFKNPVYYLEPGVSQETNGNGEAIKTENGFRIRRDTAKEDDLSANFLTMIHLYHPKKAWVPVSLGIGINSEAATRFFLGTGWRIGDEFYVTLGGTCALMKRLPDNLKEDGFTIDGNALSNLPTRNKFGVFLSVSFSFAGGTAKERFLQPFAMTSQTAASKSAGEIPPAVEITLDNEKCVFDGKTLTIVGNNFGMDGSKIALDFFEDPDGKNPDQSISGDEFKTLKNNLIEVDITNIGDLKDRDKLIFIVKIGKSKTSVTTTKKKQP
jgi:hypothetical protein